MEETTNNLTSNETTGRFFILALKSPAENSDIETGERGITRFFFQGPASKNTNERAVDDSGKPALIQSTSSNKGAIVNPGEFAQDMRETKSRENQRKKSLSDTYSSHHIQIWMGQKTKNNHPRD